MSKKNDAMIAKLQKSIDAILYTRYPNWSRLGTRLFRC
jgi:hypothetical protein